MFRHVAFCSVPVFWLIPLQSSESYNVMGSTELLTEYHMQKVPSMESCVFLIVTSQVGFNSWYWLHCHSSSRVSRTTIKNLRWQLGGEIIRVTFGKFVTSNNLRKISTQKLCNRILTTTQFIHIFLTFFDHWCYRFFKGYPTAILRLTISGNITTFHSLNFIFTGYSTN